MEVLLPRLSDGGQPDFVALLEGIVGRGPGAADAADQFDDWLPDPLYFEDLRLDRVRQVADLRAAWQAGRLSVDPPAALALPRDRSGTVPALSLPLPLRVAAHAVIADAAPRISGRILLDKVLGFGFHADRVPRFDAPGEGAWLLEEAARELIDIDYSDTIIAVDVTAFQKSATMERLWDRLVEAQVLDEQIRFVADIVSPAAAAGLPSIDDAFGFLYNLYLAPVDAAVATVGSNFFRYRDEYFLFEDSAVAAVSQGLAALGLAGRETMRTLRVEEARDTLSEMHDTELIGRIGNLEAWASYQGPLCETDCFEVYFRASAELTKAWFFKACLADQPVDAVKALPGLRDFHRARLPIAWRRPPFGPMPPAVAGYVGELSAARAPLGAALATGIGAGVPWQTAWAATLLADIGSFDGDTTQALRGAMAGTEGPLAETVRVALARSSGAAAGEIWTTPRAGDDAHTRRARGLAAYLLALRGDPMPWQEARSVLTASDPALVHFFDRL